MVYILTNKNHTVLYVGVTNDLIRRIFEHKNGLNPNSFSARYNLQKLVSFESFSSIEEEILREKQIKGGNRSKKIALINSLNSDWKDLSEEVESW